MSRFDYKTFLEITGRGGGPVQAIGTAFGMPSCLLNLGDDLLALIPSPMLNAIKGQTANGVNRADDVVKAAFAKLRFLGGHIEYDTEDGTFRFISDSSKNGIERNEGGLLSNVGGFVGALTAAAGFAGRLYNNYNSTVTQIESMKDCLQSYKDYLDYSGSNSADKRAELAALNPEAFQSVVNEEFSSEKGDFEDAMEFKLRALELLSRVDNALKDRELDPTKEPIFTDDYTNIIAATNFQLEIMEEEADTKEIFRLEFGPPESKAGKFILSVDGLYYDTQSSGIIPALTEINTRASGQPSELSWKLEHDPNLGGKGRQFTLKDFKSYVNTILDPEVVDDSEFLEQYYKDDNLLVDLIGQKNRRVFDVSGQIQDLHNVGGSTALISNLQQVMLSETAHFMEKVYRRKKQIELAVKMPSIYGTGVSFRPGEIPINDFSYLEGINFSVDIEKQRRIVINQSDVSSVVLPIEVKYTQQIEHSSEVVLDHLLLTNIGIGNIVSDGSGTEVPILGVVDQVVTDNLICLYNYLSTDIEQTSSLDFTLHNSSELINRLDAQLVGSPERIFDQGMGIVYLDGITRHSTDSPTTPSAVGSYVRLPDESELQDLLYSPRGATLDTWVHVPELDGEDYGFGVDASVSGLYRLILANENVGIQGNPQSDNILTMTTSYGSDTVKGLVLGFTRDRRFTQENTPSNESHENPIENASFFLAPTQSFDNSSAGFVSRSYYDSDNCHNVNAWHGMTFPIWTQKNGIAFSSCGREFCHIAVTFDPPKNKISMFCDGELMAASSYGDVFGISNPAERGVSIPTLKKTNSFEYDTSSMVGVGVSELLHGPILDQYFTPWILGGGYTDGYQSGNFMGGEWGGIISGLKGYLGGTKFYSRPLSQAEIQSNYNANREFFKNIDVPNLMWEPIITV